LDGYVQYVDVSLLRKELFKSLFYLHSQPPLFNLLIGVVEKTTPDQAGIIFHFLFIIIGLLTSLIMFKLLTEIGVNIYLSLVFTIFYLLSPATLLYENIFFYTYIIIFFLICASYYLVLFIHKQSKFKYALFHFLFLSLCVLTTSFFHFIWFLFLFGLLLLIKRDDWKIIIKAAILPLALILGLYIKNYLIFDSFSSSTWFGMNLSRITINELPVNEKKRLIQNGILSEFGKQQPFLPVDSLIILKDAKLDTITGIKVLDEQIKKSGFTNYNHFAYIKISESMLADALYVIINYPEIYYSGVKKAFMLYLDSPTKFNIFEQNTYKIKKYNRLFDALIYGTSPYTKFGYISLISIPLMLILGVNLIFRKETQNNVKIILFFLIFNVIYVMIIGNFFELGENNRFRYYTEIFHYIIWAIIITAMFQKKKIEQL
jgi:4-amino-4-deoxy-L-arabinose transferase-like glycosyltransferase